MFFVYNKDKIISAMIALSTVIILFLVATVVKTNKVNKKNVIETNAEIKKELPIYSVETEDKKVSLTINCAWNSDDIDLILKTLEENQVKITFFIVGDWALKFPDSVKKIYNAGHEIANHSFSHPHIEKLSYEENLEEIKKCSEIVKNIIGEETKIYRGPYGEYTENSLKAAKDLKQIAIQWSIDTLDYNGLSQEQIIDRINEKLQNGSIILMHNGTENTALSLDKIIKSIKEKGYEIVKISDLIYKENYTIDNNGMQKKMNDN